MVSPNTKWQNRRKVTFTQAIQAWRDLTDANRANWDTYANTFPVPSRKNPDAYLSGFNAFARYHGVRFLDQLQTVLSNPAGAQGTINLTALEVQSNGAQVFIYQEVVWTQGPWKLYFFMSRPLANTQQFIKSWTKYITDVTEANFDTQINVTTEYNEHYGTIPQVGDLVAIRVIYLNTTNGQVIFAPPEILTVTVG